MWKKTIWENAQYQAKNGRKNPAATLTQSSFYRDVSIACADETFFSTVSGRIGLGPRKTRPGDIVSMPFRERTLLDELD